MIMIFEREFFLKLDNSQHLFERNPVKPDKRAPVRNVGDVRRLFHNRSKKEGELNA